MFQEWIGRIVTIIHRDPKKSMTGVLISFCDETVLLGNLCDANGKSVSGQQAFCLRNPIYEKFLSEVN